MTILLAAAAAVALIWIASLVRDKHLMRRNRGNPALKRAGKSGSHDRDGLHYGSFKLSSAESAASMAVGCGAGFAVGYLFYHHPIPALLCSSVGLWAPRWRRKSKIRSRQEELRRQFKQALHALVSSLTAGRSVENAFAASVQDLRLLYSDPNTFILLEFERIDRKIANGETVESALADFGRRSGLEELLQFTEVFATCKRTGGNLAEVMRRTAQLIGEKMEIRQEIAVMLAQKRFESKVLGTAPVAVVGLLCWSSPDYMAPLYGNPAGIAIMTFCLAVFAGCWSLTKKLMDIKV